VQTAVTTHLSSIQEAIGKLTNEWILIFGIVAVLILGMVKGNRTILLSLAISIFLCSAIVAYCSISDGSYSLFFRLIHLDGFAGFFKVLISASGLLTIIMIWKNQTFQEKLAEYIALLFTATLGAQVLVMTTHLLTAFLAIEILSISSYLLVAFSFSKRGAEGSLKYFLFGSVASAVMLYGMTILYGLTGILDFSHPDFIAVLAETQSPLLYVAGIMVLVGFLFKLGVAPMHIWAPDVYEAVPMSLVAFFSSIPKIAAMALLARFTPLIAESAAFGPSLWAWVLAIVVFTTLTVGNFSALWQTKIKRLMAYSSIAQGGFLLIGLIAGDQQGLHFMMFYVVVYLMSNFAVLIYLQALENVGIHHLADFKGLGRTQVWSMTTMLIALVALIGLPPTAGFTGKLFIFSSLWETYATNYHMFLLALMLFGLLNTVVSLFYYLRIPYFAFIKEGEQRISQNNLVFENFFSTVLVLGVVYLFFNPEVLMGWINKITFVP
jgi:NADH-quinone oxidoreductase subunit N